MLDPPLPKPWGQADDLNRSGWKHLCEGRVKEAMDTFSSAIEKDPNFADAYNNRSIAKRIAGQDAEQDEDWADALTLHDKQWHETLMQQRKWMCVGYNARGEPEGRSDATDADFLISFASPDRVENNRILAELQKGVFFEGQVRLSPKILPNIELDELNYSRIRCLFDSLRELELANMLHIVSHGRFQIHHQFYPSGHWSRCNMLPSGCLEA